MSAGPGADDLAQRKAWLARLAARTPAVPIDDAATGCTIWLKLEYLLPSGSTKDRVAAFILSHGVETGMLGQGSLVVEASSGSTSIALAMACAVLGVRFRAVMPANVSPERVFIIKRYGGEVVLVPPGHGIVGAIEATRRMAEEDPSVFLVRQFDNPLNARAHQRETGPELVQQVGTTIHGFVAGVGTGGTLMGIARALREVTRRGTADGIFDSLSFPVAGKTGTAQTSNGDKKSHSWFIGFAPAQDPEIAFAVLIENGGYGARSAAPAAREILRAWSPRE